MVELYLHAEGMESKREIVFLKQETIEYKAMEWLSAPYFSEQPNDNRNYYDYQYYTYVNSAFENISN